jgi:hypothetical protein
LPMNPPPLSLISHPLWAAGGDIPIAIRTSGAVGHGGGEDTRPDGGASFPPACSMHFPECPLKVP